MVIYTSSRDLYAPARRLYAAAGFTQVRAMSLTGGIVALHSATR